MSKTDSLAVIISQVFVEGAIRFFKFDEVIGHANRSLFSVVYESNNPFPSVNSRAVKNASFGKWSSYFLAAQ